jgi:hypothetical protein
MHARCYRLPVSVHKGQIEENAAHCEGLLIRLKIAMLFYRSFSFLPLAGEYRCGKALPTMMGGMLGSCFILPAPFVWLLL